MHLPRHWKQLLLALIGVAVVGFSAGFFLGKHRREPPSVFPQRGRAVTKWSVTFTPPASFNVPETKPILKFDFARSNSQAIDGLLVTVTNLAERPYLLSCRAYGYDSKARRVSGAQEVFRIGSREKLFREIMLWPDVTTMILKARSFGFAATAFEE